MKRRQVEHTESKAYFRTTSVPPRTRSSSYTGSHILLVLLLLTLPLLSRVAHASDVVLGWNANTEPVLAGYKLYYGTASRQYNTPIDVGNVITYTVSGLPAGTYYFAVTAYSAAEETGYSNEVSAVITPPDTTPPSITDVAATGITYSTSTISWNTDEPADTQLEYGLSASYGSVAATDPALATAHTVVLSGLAASTTYHYSGKSNDAAGNLSVSGDFTFVTTAPPDTTPQSISGVAATAVTYSAATIGWSTDEPADTQLEYGLSASYGSLTATDPTPVTAHTVALSGLAASATYHYRVKSKDAAANLSVSGDFTFVTSAPPDTKPPVLTSIRSLSVSNNSATIAWTSDEPADTQVEYGQSAVYGSLTALNLAPVTLHSQVLGGLSSGTLYHFRVKSRDAAGNLAISGDSTLTTTSLPDITSSLVAAYAFDEGTGAKAADSSGGSNFATLNNAVWTSKAKFGRALSFNGKNSYVAAGVAGLPAVNAPKTISCWLSVSGGAGTTQSVIALANEAQQASVQHGFKNSQVGILQYGGTWLVAGNSPPSKAWHHFAYTFDGTQNRFYVDGVLVSSSTLKPQAASVASLQIGRWIGGCDYFKGIIDEVRIYSRALSQEEIAVVMNAPITGAQAGQPSSAVRLEVVGDDTGSEEEPASGGQDNPESEDESTVSHDSRVAIDMRMSQRTYRVGETVRTSASWLSNASSRNQSVELKTWLVAPGFAPIAVGEPGTDGSFALPAGLDQDFGSLSLFEVSKDLPAGTYQLNARVMDPVTGEILNEDINPFAVTVGEEASERGLRSMQAVEGDSKLALESNTGESVRAGLVELPGLRIANRGDTPAAVELKVWIEAPGCSPIPVFALGGEGSLVLPAGSDLDLDPLALSRSLEGLPTGSYQLKSRILDPITGQLLSETADELVIR